MKSWLIYIGAFIAGTLGYYAAMRIGAELTFGTAVNAGIMFSWVAPPLAALAMFALASGLGHGRAMKAGYWLGGIALMAVCSVLMLALIFFGIATLTEAVVVAALAVFVIGRVLTQQAWRG